VAGAPAGGCTFPEHHPDCRCGGAVRSSSCTSNPATICPVAKRGLQAPQSSNHRRAAITHTAAAGSPAVALLHILLTLRDKTSTISFSHQPVAAAAQTSALFPSKPSSRACRSYLPQARQVCAHGALCAARDARRPSLSPLPASMSNQAPFIALPQVCQVRAQRTLRAARDARRPCVSSLPGAAQCH